MTLVSFGKLPSDRKSPRGIDLPRGDGSETQVLPMERPGLGPFRLFAELLQVVWRAPPGALIPSYLCKGAGVEVARAVGDIRNPAVQEEQSIAVELGEFG